MDTIEILTQLCPNADEEVLEALVALSEADFKAETRQAEVPEAAQGVIVRMVMHRFNRLGAEGLAAQSYSGASESYAADYSDDLRRAMHRFRKVVLV